MFTQSPAHASFVLLERHVILDTFKHLVAAPILSRLDYCNSVLVSLSWATLVPLQRQRVQYAVLRLVLACQHVTMFVPH